MADQIKAELGAGREVIFYRGSAPSASTFIAPTGERLVGPPFPSAAIQVLQAGLSPLAIVEIGAKSYSVAFGPIRDVAGRRVGLLGIALDRDTWASARRRVMLTMLLGVVSVLLVALGLADILARRLTKPLGDLHAAALSIANGNLQTRLNVDSPDELGDVAEAFRVMIQSLRENREGLAARVRELVTVHQVGRAVSSVVDLNQVLRSVASEAMAVLGARTAAIALAVENEGRRTFVIRAVSGEAVGKRLAEVARLVADKGSPHRAIAVEWDPELADAAAVAGLRGPLLAAPLSLKERLVGVIVVGRLGDAPFSEADLRLLVTLADQTATAIENARLYSEVRAFSDNLEVKVSERTAELEGAKAETEDALRELRTAQSQLIHSERMAGLGLLVAGIAHEVNSPAAAIQGSADVLELTVQRLEQRGRELQSLDLSTASVARFFAIVERVMAVQKNVSLLPAVETRHLNRRLRLALEPGLGSERAAFALAELGPVAEEIAAELKEIAGEKDLLPLSGYLRELAFLVRASSTIRTAIQSIRRIVGALKRYSRLDEVPVEDVDVHAGIDDTLVILSHQLKSSEKGITITRSYGDIPSISAYAGELNQVWTNLIFNAVQAMEGSGEILIETSVQGDDVRVAIQDDGPGMQPEIMSRVFEPFFTTKSKGEGTGLGLSIAYRIVEKHGGKIRVESAPGRTRFEVVLPIRGPAKAPPPSLVQSPTQSSTQFPAQSSTQFPATDPPGKAKDRPHARERDPMLETSLVRHFVSPPVTHTRGRRHD
jgi:two-component system, NtrC family, sensor kinase